ncbi:MAG: ArnT family glycosyltransferase [Acidobacteriota bacterium]
MRTITPGRLGLGVLALSSLPYFYDLGRIPASLGGDEAHFAVQAHAIAHTARNLDGLFMPLFFNLNDPLGDDAPLPWGDTWYQPVLFYLIAAGLTWLPLAEASVRLPTALIGGVIGPLLMYAVARRLFKKRGYALAAAVLLALSPAHLILSRQAMDYVCPLPFVLGWLWLLSRFIEAGGSQRAFAAGLVLGMGCYTHLASWIQMPLYLGLSWFVCARAGRGFIRPSIASGLGFILPLMLLVPWLWAHPQTFRQTLDRYRLGDVRRVTLIRDSQTTPLIERVEATAAAYASYFHPGFLFLRGGPSPNTSTDRVGVFLGPVAVLLPIGLYALLRRRDEEGLGVVPVLGLVAAPIAAAVGGEPYMIERELTVVVFGALISAAGLATLLEARQKANRALALLLVAAVPVQFAVFYYDYFTHYQRRSIFYQDSGAIGDVTVHVVSTWAAHPAPIISLNAELDDISARWRFHTTKHGRTDLLHRTRYFTGDGQDLRDLPPGSLLVMLVKNLDIARLVDSGLWAVERVVRDVDDRAASVIMRKIA